MKNLLKHFREKVRITMNVESTERSFLEIEFRLIQQEIH